MAREIGTTPTTSEPVLKAGQAAEAYQVPGKQVEDLDRQELRERPANRRPPTMW